MLTQDILFGMNLLTLAGFVIMGLSLTLHRMAAAGRPLSIGLMCAGTALVFLGLYAGSCCQISEISGSEAAHNAGDGSQLVLLFAAVSHPNVLRRHPSTTASAALGSAPCRTSARDQLVPVRVSLEDTISHTAV